MPTENDSQEEITVEVTVPEPEPAPDPEPAPAVVIVEDSTPAPAAGGDAVLTALLDIQDRLGKLELATAGTAEIAVEADAKADLALEMDGVIASEVASVHEEVAEALTEPQAAPEDDVEPLKIHWLHR